MTQRRTMQDFAHQMRWLVDEAYPEIPVVRVVLDNLNTHRMASLSRIARRLEFHSRLLQERLYRTGAITVPFVPY